MPQKDQAGFKFHSQLSYLRMDTLGTDRSLNALIIAKVLKFIFADNDLLLCF
jgi:hypothetical protein